MQKDRITLAVCVNAIGTARLKLGAKRLGDFGKVWQPSDHVDYFHNTKAWMAMQAGSLSWTCMTTSAV